MQRFPAHIDWLEEAALGEPGFEQFLAERFALVNRVTAWESGSMTQDKRALKVSLSATQSRQHRANRQRRRERGEQQPCVYRASERDGRLGPERWRAVQ